MPSRIEDYALLGDCQTAALVSKTGSIDWCCFPRFDSGACFAALLGTADHGRWLIAPAGGITSTKRQYRDGGLILETEFETADGAVTLIDFMPYRTREPNLIRIVVGRRGKVRMNMELIVRFDYGASVPWVRQIEGDGPGIRATAGPDTLYLRTAVKLTGKDLKTYAEFEVAAGERVPFALAWSPTHEPMPVEIDPEQALREAEEHWRAWSDRCTYTGRWGEAVKRSLVTLKALTYAPTGGIVAAATTSLPERIGGPRNWDYRYCWLRDATFTLLALDVGGYTEEARAWRQWLINAVAGTPADLQIMYGVAGERRLNELTLDWLPGFENSQPVRTGNAAYQQRQIDVYGEVTDAMFQARKMNLAETKEIWQIERQLLKFLEAHWPEPDNGIWEMRGPPRHFTHSKVMAWVAFDRAVKTMERFGHASDADEWRKVRDTIHAEVCERGFDRELNSFVQHYDSKEPDASLLLIPLIGFLPATDPRVVGTVEYVQKQLTRDGLVQRYVNYAKVDGLPQGEGRFLICSFWLVDCLHLIGRCDEAQALFERLLALRNDVGLLAEEYDVSAGRMTGNFPQAFSHVGLINTANTLCGAVHHDRKQAERDRSNRAQRQ